MQGDIESLARSMMKTPQGIKMRIGLDRLNTTLSSESGRQLLQLLAGPSGDALKAAAAQAAGESRDNGRTLLSLLLASKDGALLVAKIIELTGV